MRASFQGQNIIALGNGIARLQTPPLVMDSPKKPKESGKESKPASPKSHPKPPTG
jgi:hypothetical protein